MTGRPPHPGDPWHPDWAPTGDEGDGAGSPDESSVADFDRLRPEDDGERAASPPEGDLESGEPPQQVDPAAEALEGEPDVDDVSVEEDFGDDEETGELPVVDTAEQLESVAEALPEDSAEIDAGAAGEDIDVGAAEPVVRDDSADQELSHEAAVASSATDVGTQPGVEPEAPQGLLRRLRRRRTANRTESAAEEDAEPDDVMWDEMAAALIRTPGGDWEDWSGSPDEEAQEFADDPVAAEPTEDDGATPVDTAAEELEDEPQPDDEPVTALPFAEDAGDESPVPDVEDSVETGPLVIAVPEEPDTDEVPVVGPPEAALPARTPVFREVPEDAEEEQITDEVPLPRGFGGIEDLTEEAFVALSTMEHRGLAEVMEDDDGETAVQALAAPMAGLDTGLLGFEDVVGIPDEEAEQLRSKPRRPGSNLLLRVITGLALGAIVVGAVWAGDAAIAGLATAVFLLALGEFYAVLVKAGYRPISLFGLLGGAGTLLGARVWGPVAVPGALIVTGIIVFFFFSIVPGRRDPLVNGALTLAGVAWVAGLGSFVMPLLDAADFRLLVFSVVAVTVFMDTAQYFAGRSWGFRRIAPILSPNKTVAGLIGGAAIAFGMGFALGNVDPFDTKTGLILAGAIIVAAPLGDLAVSSLKRAIGIKDMSGILPGHGGVLDRVDALLFTFPAGWLVFRWLGYLM